MNEQRARKLSISALILEDEPLWAAVLREALEPLVTTIHHCESIGAAQEVWERHNPGIILAHVGLSGENGLDFVARVRETNSRVPVILVTGDETRDVAVRAINLGVTRFVGKPVTVENLVETIEDVLAGSRLTAERHTREQYFQALIENNTDLIMVLDRSQRVRYTSVRIPDRLWSHYARREQLADVLEEKDRTTWIKAFEAAVSAPGESVTCVVRVAVGRVVTRAKTDAQYERRWLDVRIRSLLDHPDVNGVVVHARDITDERETRRRLQELERQLQARVESTEARYRALFEVLPLGVVIVDRHDRFLDYNAAAASILNLVERLNVESNELPPADDDAWRPIRLDGSVIPPSERPVHKCRRLGVPVVNEVIGIDVGRPSIRWLKISATPFELAGDDSSVMIVFSDITAEIRKDISQVHLLNRLERSSANLHFINAWLTDLARFTNPIGRLGNMMREVRSVPFLTYITVYQYDADCRLLGVIAETGASRWPTPIRMHTAWLEMLRRKPLLIESQQIPASVRDAMSDTTGEELPGRLLVVPIHNQDRLDGVMVFESAIGYGRQVREVCTALAGTVAMMFQKNRDQNEQARLARVQRQQEKFMLQAERLAALGSLTSAIGHEINQPLQSIKIIADSTLFWIDEHSVPPDPERMKDSLVRISERADWAASIVRNMKLVFRDPEQITIEDVDLDQVVGSSIGVIREQLNSAEIKIAIDLDPRVRTFPFSEVQLKQVLVNLLKNSVRVLTQQSAGERRVSIRSCVQNGCAQIRVEDNGPGIPDRLKERVFDPFYTTSDKTEGMGLGLYVVHTVVRALRCTIRVEDVAGGGARFIIEAPSPGTQ